jgi:dynein heavy chain
LINFTTPKHVTMVRIFKTILTPHLEKFNDEIKSMSLSLVEASVELYNAIQENFLPTPSKCHYLFNMRDLAKVTLGLLQSDPTVMLSDVAMKKLWVHEASRVFADRFIDHSDLTRFRELMSGICESKLEDSLNGINAGVSDVEKGAIFISLSDQEDPPYAEVADVTSLKTKLEDTLEDYSTEPGMLPMVLVLFDDAIRHITRIARVIKQPRGNCMLIGVGGSGRQSLTRLAAYAMKIKVFAIEITKNYRSNEFHEDIKKLMYATGVKKEPTVFLFNDTQLKEASFLEDINNILSAGEVPNLYEADEIAPLIDEIRVDGAAVGAETASELWDFFVARTRENLHVVLCMSPVGDNFRNRCRMYPSLVSCTTMDFFFPWPADALKDVAQHYLAETDLGDSNTLRDELGQIFALVHQSVENASVKMLAEQKRTNYVTPTHYLELVVGYQALMKEKRAFLGSSRDKLANGLSKLDESSKEVQEMSLELEVQQVVVTERSQQCETLLIDIVAKKKKADDKKRQVEGQAAKVNAEKKEAETMKAEAQTELDKAMPMLYDALAKVECLNRGHIAQVKGYADPHRLIRMTGAAVLVLFGQNKADWSMSQKKLGQTDFLRQVMTYDKDNISPAMIKRLDKYVQDPEFQEELVTTKSAAAGALCVWVHAMHTYALVNRTVEPKKLKVKRLEQALMTKEKALAAANEILASVIAEVQELENTYNENNDALLALQDRAESLSTKLRRADSLVNGLAGERDRWEQSIVMFTNSLQHLPGDCLIAAAFVSYNGPFDTEYRKNLTAMWFDRVIEANIPMTKGLSVAGFLSDDATVQDWNVKGLPRDTFSTENGVMVTRGRRWPLMVDPQGQANAWIKQLQGAELKVTDLGSKNFLRLLENAISFGAPYLLQDVEEELDPAFEPVLSKAIIRIGNRQVIRIGDKELDYSNDFRFYMTTKLANPRYPPEITTKTLIINFSVKEQGLREQLLGAVVELERPELQ